MHARRWIRRRSGWVGLSVALVVGTGPGAAAGQTDPGFQVVGSSFVALQVRDDAALATWYRDTFGLVELRHLESEDGSRSIRILRGGGVAVEIIRADGAEAPAGRWSYGLFKAGFWVDDIQAAHAWFLDRGEGTDASILLDETLGARTFVTRDPEGNRLQLFFDCGERCSPSPR